MISDVLNLQAMLYPHMTYKHCTAEKKCASYEEAQPFSTTLCHTTCTNTLMIQQRLDGQEEVQYKGPTDDSIKWSGRNHASECE